jgi:cell wall-associated NlpC family hydrolase
MPVGLPRSVRTSTLSRVAGALLVLGAPVAGISAQEHLTPNPDKPFSALSASAQSLRDSIIALARAQVGTRYRIGGQTPDRGFDCSGLVRYIMSALSFSLPRTAAQQAKLGQEVGKDRDHLKPGDLLTFGRGSRITHIGIYVGDGRWVHASTTKGRVIETTLDRPRSPLLRNWRGVRRVIAEDERLAERDTLR